MGTFPFIKVFFYFESSFVTAGQIIINEENKYPLSNNKDHLVWQSTTFWPYSIGWFLLGKFDRIPGILFQHWLLAMSAQDGYYLLLFVQNTTVAGLDMSEISKMSTLGQNGAINMLCQLQYCKWAHCAMKSIQWDVIDMVCCVITLTEFESFAWRTVHICLCRNHSGSRVWSISV